MLYKASKSSRSAQIWVNEDGHHNDTWYTNKDTYLARLRSFMHSQHQEARKRRSQAGDEGDGKTVRRVVKYSTVIEPASPKTKDQPSGARQMDADL